MLQSILQCPGLSHSVLDCTTVSRTVPQYHTIFYSVLDCTSVQDCPMVSHNILQCPRLSWTVPQYLRVSKMSQMISNCLSVSSFLRISKNDQMCLRMIVSKINPLSIHPSICPLFHPSLHVIYNFSIHSPRPCIYLFTVLPSLHPFNLSILPSVSRCALYFKRQRS